MSFVSTDPASPFEYIFTDKTYALNIVTALRTHAPPGVEYRLSTYTKVSP